MSWFCGRHCQNLPETSEDIQDLNIITSIMLSLPLGTSIVNGHVRSVMYQTEPPFFLERTETEKGKEGYQLQDLRRQEMECIENDRFSSQSRQA